VDKRVSVADPETGELKKQSAVESWSGALLGFVGTLFTLAIGGTLLTIVEQLLTMNPQGTFIAGKLGFPQLIYGAGIWLAIPGAIVGYRLGFDQTLHHLGIFWSSTRPHSPRRSLCYWLVLSLVCVLSRLIGAGIYFLLS
jgi:hypothetical protein